ncbi:MULTISPECIES: TetR family transcriptional regulator [Pseudomonas]|uniref:TetR family transcriptional regulator n=1 Tax=Pseudomonas flexibilis TaxID=706570 RepID=A0A0B3BTX6_9PSED|nr:MULTISPECIES: TetR family transcriptional regulator [Pseudomonas]KHO64114.1 TetR family transcriptional regulator [Pseudomonas flexibilis]SCY17190.1 transcriptional regulator, TetR family [Pseudomonas flexibilis]
MTLMETPLAQGKRLLLDAALRLMARTHSLSSLGLRELAREAGLNPNTFYRHFGSIEELGLVLITQIGTQLRRPLRELRREAAQRTLQQARGEQLLGADLTRGRQVCRETVQLFFDFVEQNPDGFIVGMRELHGASPMLRKALRELMADFAQDMAEDIAEFGLVPGVDEETLLRMASTITRHLFVLAQDYLEQPERQAAVRGEAEELIITLLAGALALRQGIRAAGGPGSPGP